VAAYGRRTRPSLSWRRPLLRTTPMRRGRRASPTSAHRRLSSTSRRAGQLRKGATASSSQDLTRGTASQKAAGCGERQRELNVASCFPSGQTHFLVNVPAGQLQAPVRQHPRCEGRAASGDGSLGPARRRPPASAGALAARAERGDHRGTQLEPAAFALGERVVTVNNGFCRNHLVCVPNGSAVKLPARTCTRRAVWSMTWSWRAPATHFYAPRKRRPASSAG
jgi:hypothetical protein